MSEKTFITDWDSIDELNHLSNILKSRIGELRSTNGGSRRQRMAEVLTACDNILATDISVIYTSMGLDPTPKYYVYAHLDPTHKIAIGKHAITSFAATIGMKCFPFYIGKGSGSRAYDLNRNETHRKIKQKLEKFSLYPDVFIIKDKLSELDALCLESKLIDIFGLLVNNGRLVNLDEGLMPEIRRQYYKDDLEKLSRYYQNSA
jgi:hypothetical protein